MAQKAKKPCAYHGCRNLIRDGRFCFKHQEESKNQRKESNRYYDQYLRNKKARLFYNSKAWLATRQYVLTKYNYLDLYDYYINSRVTRATAVHHIEELEEAWEKKLEISNLIPLSSSNHNHMDLLYRHDKEGTQALLRELLSRWEFDWRKGYGSGHNTRHHVK